MATELERRHLGPEPKLSHVHERLDGAIAVALLFRYVPHYATLGSPVIARLVARHHAMQRRCLATAHSKWFGGKVA